MLLQANALNIPLADNSVHCAITSPPYWGLRDYGTPGQLGLETTPDEYVANMVAVFREVRRVLRNDGTLWLNLGDSYGHGTDAVRQKSRTSDKISDAQHEAQGGRHGGVAKQLQGIPWRVAFALQADGWWLRSDIIWAKPNPMPESVTDRPTKSHEYLFLLAKSARYYYDAEAVKEGKAESTVNDKRDNGNGHRRDRDYPGAPSNGGTNLGGSEGGRNRRSVWNIATQPYSGAHFATFPEKLVEPCLLAGTSERGCCPHCGAPWARVVERESNGRTFPGNGLGWDERKAGGSGGSGGHVVATTTGWLPTCACPAHEPVPCLVLDPFNGSGTTGRVAVQHRRRYVGTELNQDYIALAHERTGRVQIEMAV